MGILLYFLAGLAFLAGGIWAITLGAEWWCNLILIGFGLVCVAIALYKLNEETDCFTNAHAERKNRKIQKISGGKYKKTPLDMVPMMVRAYDERKERGAGYIEKRALKCITSGYEAMRKNWKYVAKERPDLTGHLNASSAENILFAAVMDLVTVFIAIDGNIDKDYDIYRKFGKQANRDFVPLSKTQLKKEYERLITRDEQGYSPLIQPASFIKSVCRGCIPSSAYEDFVMGFCYLALTDNSVYEDEYALLEVMFFDAELDRYPKTWEQFKKEY